MFRREFPRKPDQEELEVLFRILPENKSGYRNYRKIISESYLTGTGSSDESLVLSRNPKQIIPNLLLRFLPQVHSFIRTMCWM
jgi:hypothetical protein